MIYLSLKDVTSSKLSLITESESESLVSEISFSVKSNSVKLFSIILFASEQRGSSGNCHLMTNFCN